MKMGDALHLLRKGGLVVYPTETAYGLGCDATNADAVRRVYAVKGRARGKPLATIAADTAMVKRFFTLTGTAARLARHHWPGALTIVLPARDARLRRALGAHVGVRVSSHRTARALSRGLGRPIVATSANKSGRGNCYSPACVQQNFGTMMLCSIIVPRKLRRRRPSTVVELDRGQLIIHRRGAVRIGNTKVKTQK